ncbi:MAG: STAS-like domain-containing protein [Bacteroidales bacterium]|jgi:Icc-related predicted phosphoesterase|nr:STAS-like domain-containing protein [Bacteroidales bacterium]
MENTEININIVNTIGDVYAVEAEDGQKVFDLIKKVFDEKRNVVLNFINVEIMTSAFLNTAIGQLYKDFSEDFIRDNLKVENISNSGKIILKRVVDTAKMFYNDPNTFERLQKSIDDILNE